MGKRNNLSTWGRLLVGLIFLFLFTQIEWGDYFFSTKKMENIEVDNTALFYTESEEAMDAAFYIKKK